MNITYIRCERLSLRWASYQRCMYYKTCPVYIILCLDIKLLTDNIDSNSVKTEESKRIYLYSVGQTSYYIFYYFHYNIAYQLPIALLKLSNHSNICIPFKHTHLNSNVHSFELLPLQNRVCLSVRFPSCVQKFVSAIDGICDQCFSQTSFEFRWRRGTFYLI